MSSDPSKSESSFPHLDDVEIDSKYERVVLLTGASTGIGFATAKFLAERQTFVLATVRREEDAVRLLGQNVGICPVLLDVCNGDQVNGMASEVEALLSRHDIHRLDALINNAGIALGGPLIELDDDTLQRQLEVNVVAPMRMVRAFASLLGVKAGSSKGGRVIQVGSISGERAMPFVGPYTASKFALEGLSDSLRMELLPFGVDVIIVRPGPINTEIWDKAPTPETSPFAEGLYSRSLALFYKLVVEGGRKGFPPVVIAEVIHHALVTPKPKPRYTKTPGYFTRVFLPKRLPTRVFDHIIGRLLDLLPKRFHQPPQK